MMQVTKPKTAEDVTNILHQLMVLFSMLTTEMMTIDLGRPENDIGQPFGDCDGSNMLEMMVISGRAAMELGKTCEVKQLLCDFVAANKAEISEAMDQPMIDHFLREGPELIVFKKNSGNVH